VHNALKFSAVTGAASANNCKEMHFNCYIDQDIKTIFNLESNDTYTTRDTSNPSAATGPLE
jgi:hypothetical protein